MQFATVTLFIKLVYRRPPVTYKHVVSCFILRFKFDFDTFPTRMFYYFTQILRSIGAANRSTVLYLCVIAEV